MVTRTNNSHLNRTCLSNAHICLVPALSLSICISPICSVSHFICLSGILLPCHTPWWSSYGAGLRHQMKHSLHRLGTSADNVWVDGKSGWDGWEKEALNEHKWLTSLELGRMICLIMNIHVHVNAAASSLADWHWSFVSVQKHHCGKYCEKIFKFHQNFSHRVMESGSQFPSPKNKVKIKLCFLASQISGISKMD